MTFAGSGEGRPLLRRAAPASPTVRPQTSRPPTAGHGRARHVGRGLLGVLLRGHVAVQLCHVVGKAADALLEKGFDKVVSASIATSTGPLAPVPAWNVDIEAYTRYNTADAAKIQAGRSRSARWHQNGLILAIQPGAAAITLGTDIFVRSGHWNELIYVHELVHVAQYDTGKATFLISYFRLAAKEIAKRFLTGKPLHPLTASPYETEAYGVEKRFLGWLRAGKPIPGP